MAALNNIVEENMLVEEMEDELLFHRLRSGDLSVLLGIPQRHPDPDHLKASTSLFDNAVVERCPSLGEESDKEPEPLSQDLVVRGEDIGDLPIQYVVRGLRTHEMPVIGVYVDLNIMPGFRYRVRRLGTDDYLFQGRAVTLLSVGLGYGKRLTFSGDSLNFNDNYFWSDSDPNGFAFSIDAVLPGSELTVYGNDGQGIIGEVMVERLLGVQEEISSEVVKGDVIKRIRVTLECNLTYIKRHHNKVDLKLCDVERMTGEAIVVKRKGTRVAALDCIHNVSLACVAGKCTLQVES